MLAARLDLRAKGERRIEGWNRCGHAALLTQRTRPWEDARTSRGGLRVRARTRGRGEPSRRRERGRYVAIGEVARAPCRLREGSPRPRTDAPPTRRTHERLDPTN